jgi:hypothetical protein
MCAQILMWVSDNFRTRSFGTIMCYTYGFGSSLGSCGELLGNGPVVFLDVAYLSGLPQQCSISIEFICTLVREDQKDVTVA